MDDRFNRYFDEMPCYLTVQDRDFRIIDANKRFRKNFGEYEGRYCYQVYKGRSERCEVCPVERVFRDGVSHRSEERVTCLNGKRVSVLVEATPVRDDDGEIIAVMEMSTDVTEIKDLEARLRRSQRHYHLLFDEVPCYITIQDPQLNIVEANRAFQDDFGNGLGCKCFEAYKHRSEPCIPCPVQATFDDGEPHTREEVVTSRDGKRMNVLVTAAPIRNKDGDVTAVMEMSANITQVRELEDRLTSLGLLIGSVSHGLKGLLNGLRGGMYLVETGFRKGDDARVKKGWDAVQRNTGRIQSMVSDILYYAKDRVPNWEPVQTDEVVAEVCSQVEKRAGESGVRLITECDGTGGKVEADAQAVRSLLANLVENSIDACRLDDKPQHRVTVRVAGFPEHVEFEVEDNGIGMDQEAREKAFSLFFSSKGMEGTGLGLFVSDRIARAHGGSIELESNPGEGTRFLVRLPRVRSRENAPAKKHLTQMEVSHE